MHGAKIPDSIKKIPQGPGVYLFKRGKTILYIGKATSLRSRVRSYFSAQVLETRSPLVSAMLERFDTIDYMETSSVLEALVLEAHLIKKYQPEANIKEKDNKSFNFVVITKEDFPRVLIARGRELLHNTLSGEGTRYLIDTTFGPFPSSRELKEALRLVRKLFPFRDTCVPPEAGGSGRPCFNYQIGLCPGVCVGKVSKAEYKKHIDHIKLFFQSDKSKLITSLQKEMTMYVKKQEFEKAAELKKRLFNIEHIQDVSLVSEERDIDDSFRIESYDIAHLFGKDVVGVMTVVSGGAAQKKEYRKFLIKDPGINDTKALAEILTRRLAHIEWPLPNLVVVDGGVAQKNAMEKVLTAHKLSIPVVSVVKDERHKAREILGIRPFMQYEKDILLSNIEAHRFAISFHKHIRRRHFGV